MSSTGFPGADETLNIAQAELARGAFDAASRRVLNIETALHGAALRRAAELLIVARCDEDASRFAARIAAEPSGAWPWIRQFAGHMRAKGNLTASRHVLRAFLDHATQPGARVRAELALALGLPSAYRSSTEMNSVRDDFLRRLEEFSRTHWPLSPQMQGVNADDLVWSNFFLAYQGGDDRSAQIAYGNWLSASLAAVLAEFAAELPPRRTDSTRIAIVSGRLHECTAGWYFSSWIEHLAAAGWSVVLVHTADARQDGLTDRLNRSAREHIVLPPNIADGARAIRALVADIVLYPELGMDGFVFALAALRLAPHQLCAWGHPVTTGLPTIDAFLSCTEMEPPDADAHYSEKLIRLPGIGTKYTSPHIPVARTLSDMGLPIDRPLYLMPQALYKLHPESDRILAEIVRRDPRAVFVLFELRSPSPALLVRDRLLRALSEVSETPHAHLFWIPECSRDDYLRINQACAVMIDTPHWSGGNATLDALHCGLPVVTCPGTFMRGRQSAAMLRMLGCDELIAADVEALADIAVGIANDRAQRDRIAERIRVRLPAMTQSEAPLLALDVALRSLIMSGQ